MLDPMKHLALVAVAVLLVAEPTQAQAAPDPTGDSDALEQLLENVRYWQARGRADKAAEAWHKVLRSVPTHPEALADLALFAARSGKNTEARGYLDRLKKAHPNSSRVPQLEAALGLGAKYDDFLTQARTAVRSGKVAEGLDLYRKIFAGQAPSGPVGLEYYQTLGGTAGGWEEARTGLARLVSDNASDPRYGVGFARHLTYVEATRRDGIDRLEQLADGGEGRNARAAWRQALLWLLIGPNDFPRYERYLQRFPNDQEVKGRVVDVKAGVVAKQAADAGRDRLKAGYTALDSESVDEAENIFRRAVRTNARDVEAMAGLANVLLRKEQFEEAKATLLRVKDVAPKRRELWEEALKSAEFWSLVRKAEVLRAESKPNEAEVLLREAMTKLPKEAPHARLVLANVLVDASRVDEAQAEFEALVAADPKHVPAMKGLIELYLREGDQEKALTANAALMAIDAEAAWKENWIRAEMLRREAVAQRKKGLLAEAESLLDAALATDPQSKNVMLEQIYTYLDLGKASEARRSVDAAKRIDKADKQVKVAEAWVFASEQRFEEGLAALESLKDADLDAGTRSLKRRLRVEGDAVDAIKQAGRGKLISAQARLTELQRSTRDEPMLLGLVANAWADIGKFDQALAIIYDALSTSKTETPTLKLQLASILHKADREAELLAVLRELEGESDLTVPERQGLANLKIAYSIKRADIAREGGFLARAFNLLQEPLREHQNDPRLMTALGRLFVTAGEYQEADELFQRVLTMTPDSIEARQGAIQSAVEMGNKDAARELAEQGVRLSPDNPRMHLVAGRMHVLIGEDGDAVDAFERALALEEGRSSPELEPDTRVSKLLAGAEARFGGKRRSSPEDITLRSEIISEIKQLQARHSVRLGTSTRARHRPGISGLGQVLSIDFPTWVSIPTGYRGRLTFTATPVLLDAGVFDLGRAQSGQQFGTSGVDLTELERTGEFAQKATGVELSLREEIGAFRFEVGSTPLGFLRQTIVGNFVWNESFGDFGIRLEGYRRSVIESLLSWGGTTDIATDTVWGGVTRNGGRLDLGLSIDNVIWYVVGSGNWLIGERVASNWSVEAGTGLAWKVYDWEGVSFGTGLDVSTMFFDKNLRHFTVGHGGYFSPQAFASVGFPISVRKTTGDLTYDARASIGLVWFREAAAPYYPTDPSRQNDRDELVDADDQPVESFHPGQDGLSFSFNLDGELAYEVARGLKLGVRASVHTGHDFQEYQGGLFLGYTFQQKVAGPGDKTPFGVE